MMAIDLTIKNCSQSKLNKVLDHPLTFISLESVKKEKNLFLLVEGKYAEIKIMG